MTDTPYRPAEPNPASGRLPAGRFLPLIGRALLAAIFLISGASKIASPASTIAYIGSAGMPFPLMGYLGAVAVEVGIGLALILGYRTRAAALLLAAFAIATAIVFHHAFVDQNQFVHFLKNVAIAGGLLQVAAFGPGPISLDGRR